MQKLNTVDMIAFVLTIIGGLNWGLVGLANYNVVDSIFGMGSMLAKLIYVLVGLSAIYLAVTVMKLERK